MRNHGWQLGKIGAVAAVAAAIALSPASARAEFDFTIDTAKTSSKAFKLERTGPAKDFVQRAAVYLRYIPEKGRVYPAWINTHNYLTCPDKGDKKWHLESVSRVDYDKGTGIGIFAFFFSRPDCENATFHMETITAES